MGSTVLYKRDSKGNVIKWGVRVHNSGGYTQLIIAYGQLDGKMAISNVSITKGKNIGKANETTPLEQAESQAMAMITSKVNDGYRSLKSLNVNPDMDDISLKGLLIKHLPVEGTDKNNNPKPMLCKEYFKSKKNWRDPEGKLWSDRKYYYTLNYRAFKASDAITIKFPALIQPKINGVRCNISLNDLGKIVLRSKNGIEFNIPHIREAFEKHKEIFTYTDVATGNSKLVTFDGELYIHGMVLGDIVSAVKGNNANTAKLSYIGYDLAIEGETNKDRIILLESLIGKNSNFADNDYVRTVTTRIAHTDTEVQTYTDEHIGKGFEGSVLRCPKAKYQFDKRPDTMVKLKRCMSEEFKIVDIVPQKVDKELGMYKCITPDGETFEVMPHSSKSAQKELLLLKTKTIGKMLTVDFYEYTKKLIPFHILHNVVRDYE